MNSNEGTKAFHVAADAGKDWDVFGVKITAKVMSEQTNGEYAVIVTHTPPQGGPPMHVHQFEDELFYVLKGKYEFFCGDDKIIAEEGSLVSLPRGIPHRFSNVDSVEGITMNTITPGGFEGFFEDIAQLAEGGKPARNQIDSVALLYGMQFVRK